MSKKIDDSMLGKRIGGNSESINQETIANEIIEGLSLSQIQYKPPEFFKPNPHNIIFDSLKTEEQLNRLEKDIDDARTILNPLISMPDGLIIEGHSRLQIAKKLLEKGKGIGNLPVRIVTTPLLPEEIKKRVYLGNLSRFEIDNDTKLVLYAEVYPNYFQLDKSKPGRKSDHGDTITVSEISKKLGKSIPQVKRDAAIYRDALKNSKGVPSIEAIKQSRTAFNKKRKKESFNHSVTKEYCLDSDLIALPTIGKDINDNTWDYHIDIQHILEYAEKVKSLGYENIAMGFEYLAERIQKLDDKISLLIAEEKNNSK